MFYWNLFGKKYIFKSQRTHYIKAYLIDIYSNKSFCRFLQQCMQILPLAHLLNNQPLNMIGTA